MKRFGNFYTAIALISFVVLGLAGDAAAQRRNERQIRDTIRTLNAQIDDFQYGLDYQLRNNSSSRTPDVETVHDSIRNLQTKIDDFEENLSNRRENRDDVREIIDAAKDVDVFLANNPQNRRINGNWQSVRTTINDLASNYGVVPDWSTRVSAIPGNTRDQSGDVIQPRRTTSTSIGLTGTYQLDTARSENVADIISHTTVAGTQKQDLEAKLEAPEQIAIDVRGNQVTLASSKASPVSFVADGREKTEQLNGRTVRLKASLRGDELTVTSLGGETDYAVTFLSMDGGRSMKVTRRITADYMSESVFAESVYTKTDGVAGLGIDSNSNSSDNTGYSSNDPNDRPGSQPSIVQGRIGEFIVPSGTIVTGLLESSIDTKVTQNNDRFKLTVQSPDEFRGATIEGYLTGVGRSGQVSGRSNVTFNFETITLRDGKKYDFAGYLQAVKDQNGKEVKIDSEGTAKSDSQTRETAKRGGIGAGLGAIIGAIAGGGKGAAIGAIIGGGAGAGSVIVQGREDLQLMKGSTITIQSTSPSQSANRQPRDN